MSPLGRGNAEAAAEEGEAGATSSGTPATKSSGWSGFGRVAGKGVAHQDDDDKNIRFTIGGIGQRMTKDDFIREVQQLDVRTRKEVVDHSTASSAIKKLAQDGPPSARMAGGQPVPGVVERSSNSSIRESSRGRSASVSPRRSQSSASSSESPKGNRFIRSPGLDQTETPVERKRRLAVLANQGDDDDDGDDDAADDEFEGETPAERRRRHAALGGAGDSDSEDEGTERVPPARRGIRFAEPQRGSRRG